MQILPSLDKLLILLEVNLSIISPHVRLLDILSVCLLVFLIWLPKEEGEVTLPWSYRNNSFSRIFAFNKYFFISSAVQIIRAWWRQPQPRHSQQAQGRDAEPARDQAVYRANRQVPAPGRRQRHRPADWRAGAVMGKWLDWRLHHHARTCSCAGSCSWW